MRTRFIAVLLITLAALATVPAPAHAEETMWQAWLASRPKHKTIEIGDAKPICREYMGTGQESQLMDCLKKSITGIDVVNAEARTGLINDVEWIIQWIVRHMQQYDPGTLAKLAPVADKLVEIANDPPVGLTDAERAQLNELAALAGRVVQLETTSNDHEKRIAALEHTFTLGIRTELHVTGYTPVIAGLGCPLDITFWSGSAGLRGCVGGGVATNDGSGVLVVSGEFLARLYKTPVYFIFGYQYLRDIGPTNVAGAPWIESQGTVGILLQPWGDLIGIRGWLGGGECDERHEAGESGKYVCAEIAGGLAFRVP